MPATVVGRQRIVSVIAVTVKALSIAVTLKIKDGTSYSQTKETKRVYQFMRFLHFQRQILLQALDNKLALMV